MATITGESRTEAGSSRTPPGPGGLPLLGSVLSMRREGPLAFYTRMWREYGDVFHHRVGRIPVYVFIHPRDVEYVVAANEDGFAKDTIIEHRGRRVIGKSLLMADWEGWSHLRPLMDPPFSRSAIPEFYGSISEATDMLLRRWQTIAGRGEMVDVADEMKLVSFSMISRFIFGEDLTQEASAGRNAINFLMGYVQNSILAVVDIPPSVPTPRNRRFHAATRELGTFVARHIEARRRASDPEPRDLIGHLLLARDQNGRGMSDAEIRDNVLATFVAGQQMTGLILAWCWYLLSQHPEVEERLHAELSAVLGGRMPTLDDLPRLDYTRRVIEETMRLYPTVWIQARIARQDDVIGGRLVPRGATVALIEYLTHRHPEFWPDPEGFDPDRLLPERVEDLPRYAFFPFGGGKRKCIGNKYSIHAFLVVLATLAQHFQLRLKPNHPVEPIAVAAIRPRYGLPMTIEARS